jgi:peptidoglycan/xylan/chitin deacetylase (PgdA/CDA1 family)
LRPAALVKRGVAFSLLHSGLLSLHRRAVARGRAAILVYHRVNDEADPFFPALPAKHFVAQLEHVARHCRVEPLEAVLDWLEDGAPGPARVVITIDDGYPDTCETVLPTLERLGLPATLFLCTGPVETGLPVWGERVRQILKHARRKALDLPGLSLSISGLDSPRTRQRACAQVLARLKRQTPVAIQSALALLEEQLDPPPHRAAQLTWEQVVRMAQGPIRLGAHTHSHYQLSQLDDAQIASEVGTSIELVERHTGVRPRTFAYPNGKMGDYDGRAAPILRSLGIRCALTSRHGFARPGQDPYQLSRLYTTEDFLPLFATRVGGLSLDLMYREEAGAAALAGAE